MTTADAESPTISLPPPWSYSGPTPARLPTFTFDYAGFNGPPVAEYVATLQWSIPSLSGFTFAVLSMAATPNFQIGANTVTVPDLSSVAGFFAAPSDTTVTWTAQIVTGTVVNLPVNSSGAFVSNRGTYLAPPGP